MKKEIKFIPFILFCGIMGIVIETLLYPEFLSLFLKNISPQNKIVFISLATTIIFSMGIAIGSWLFLILNRTIDLQTEVKNKLLAIIICFAVFIGWIGIFCVSVAGTIIAFVYFLYHPLLENGGWGWFPVVFFILMLLPIAGFCGVIWGFIQSREIAKQTQIGKTGRRIIFLLATIIGVIFLYLEWNFCGKPPLFELKAKIPMGKLIYSSDDALYMLTSKSKKPQVSWYKHENKFALELSPKRKYISFIAVKKKRLEKSALGERELTWSELSTDLRLWIDKFEGMNRKMISSQYAEHPSWNQDETLLVFSSKRKDTNGDGIINYEDNSDLCLVNIITNKLTWLTNTDEISEYYPVFSPDDQKICYLIAFPSISSLGVINVNGTDDKILMTNKKGIMDINWSPDSKEIVYDLYGEEIWKLNIIKEEKIQLISGLKGKSGPIWSPDGKKILFHTYGYLWIMDNNGKKQRKLIEVEGILDGYVWSPDSSQVAFCVSTTGKITTKHRIWVIDSNGRTKKLVAKGNGEGKLIRWSF